MNALIIYTHPNPGSFNHAIFETARETLEAAGHHVKCRKLYDGDFKTTLDGADFQAFARGEMPQDIAREQELVEWADLLVFVYPVWWYDRPARLKGWIDRTWTSGFAFRYGPDGVEGLLSGKQAVVFQTTGAPREAYEADGGVEVIERPMRDGTLRFCGLEVPVYETFHAVPYVADETRASMLEVVRSKLATLSARADAQAWSSSQAMRSHDSA